MTVLTPAPSIEELRNDLNILEKHEQKVALAHDELIVMVDCSGSMKHLVIDVLEGFNTMLRHTAVNKPATIFSFYKFNHDLHPIEKAKPIIDIAPLKRFEVMGGTALFTSITRVITENAIRIGNSPKEPRSVTLAIFSDGEDSEEDSDEFIEAKNLILESQANGWNVEFYLMDSLAPEIAIKLGVSPKQIKDASNIQEAFLQIGQQK